MKLALLSSIVIALLLTACSDPKPGQYPPSLYKEREGLLSDSDLAKSQQQENNKQAAELAEESYPADDPAVPHAEADEADAAESSDQASNEEADDSAGSSEEAPKKDDKASKQE